jgi:hypothetical protein
MNLKFWLKTALYRWTPGGYGYSRYMRLYRDEGYIHERDMHLVRRKHHGEMGWQQHWQDGLLYRDYADYDEYRTHQQQKFDEILKLKGGFNNKVIAEYRLKFYRRFKYISKLLPQTACIVCAGARQGTEVEVLHDLGFKNTYGIDLNPGPDNSWVRFGDFMHMENDTSSVDLIYSNCVDHAFNLADFLAEHRRVIQPNGYILYDLALASGSALGPFEAVAWQSEESLIKLMLHYFETIVRVESEPGWKWVLFQGKREKYAFVR